MRKIKRLVARTAISANKLLLVTPCLLALAFHTGNSRATSSGAAGPGGTSMPQAVIAYGFLRWGYLEFDQLVKSNPTLPVVQNLKVLDEALDSLHCDVPTRMASPHQAVILPPDLRGQWIGFSRPGGRNSRESAWLFVTDPKDTKQHRVLVVFSSAAPEHSTIFWLDDNSGRYSASLLYDSLKRGKVSNAPTTVGAITSVKLEKDNIISLKDWGEPGIGPPGSTGARRVFQLNLSDGAMALDEPAAARSQ